MFEDSEHLGDQLIALFAGTLFDWSRTWDSLLVVPFCCLKIPFPLVHNFFFSVFIHIFLAISFFCMK